MIAAQFYVLDRANLNKKSLANENAICAYFNEPGKAHLSHVNGAYCKSENCPMVHQRYPHWPEFGTLFEDDGDLPPNALPLFMNYAKFEDGRILQTVIDTYPLFLELRKPILDVMQKQHGESMEKIGFCLACGKIGKTKMKKMKKETQNSEIVGLTQLCIQAAANQGFATQWIEQDDLQLLDMQTPRARDYYLLELERPQLPDRSKERIKKIEMYALAENWMVVMSNLRTCPSKNCKNPRLKSERFDPGYICFKTLTDEDTHINAVFSLKGKCKSRFCQNCGGAKSIDHIAKFLLDINKSASQGNNWNMLIDMHYRIQEYGVSVMVKQTRYEIFKFDFPFDEMEDDEFEDEGVEDLD